MKHLIATLILLSPMFASANSDEAWDQLIWDFSGFTQSFEAMNWQAVYPFISDQTKVGFGGEQGIEGVKQVYGDGGQCYQAMLFALKQGCKKSNENSNKVCTSPPQWTDESVVYLGARARFIYLETEKKWLADFLICGGD